jgi:hypothetical protein
MATKDELIRDLEAFAGAAKKAHATLKSVPDLDQRYHKLLDGMLTRIPEQIEDVKANFSDPHLQARRDRADRLIQ